MMCRTSIHQQQRSSNIFPSQHGVQPEWNLQVMFPDPAALSLLFNRVVWCCKVLTNCYNAFYRWYTQQASSTNDERGECSGWWTGCQSKYFSSIVGAVYIQVTGVYFITAQIYAFQIVKRFWKVKEQVIPHRIASLRSIPANTAFIWLYQIGSMTPFVK